MAYILAEDEAGWKICRDTISGDYVLVELLIPTGTVIYRPDLKANPVCGQAVTVEFWRGNLIIPNVKTATSFMTATRVIYERGVTTKARESYHENPGYDGLHFFWTKEEIKREAQRYNLPTEVI